jgi:hypothetical protein
MSGIMPCFVCSDKLAGSGTGVVTEIFLAAPCGFVVPSKSVCGSSGARSICREISPSVVEGTDDGAQEGSSKIAAFEFPYRK